MTNDPGSLQGLDGLAQHPLARRGLVTTALITGFTLATTRVEAQAIHTDMAGIEAGEVKIPSGGFQVPSYFARPQGNGPFPIVVVNEEIFGIHEYIKDVCRRLAKDGYLAVAPEIYARAGDIAQVSDIQVILRDFVSKTPDTQIMADLDAAVAWAAANKGNAARLATTGFCRGGRTVWMYDAHNPSLKAAVAWYGPVGGNKTEISPNTPLDIAADLKAPLLGLYGGRDTGIPVETVLAAAAKARAAGKKVEIQIFPEATHGFHADYRPSYRADAALAGWARMLAFFKENGV
jgi:carboxymethylenebutenolidase